MDAMYRQLKPARVTPEMKEAAPTWMLGSGYTPHSAPGLIRRGLNAAGITSTLQAPGHTDPAVARNVATAAGGAIGAGLGGFPGAAIGAVTGNVGHRVLRGLAAPLRVTQDRPQPGSVAPAAALPSVTHAQGVAGPPVTMTPMESALANLRGGR